MKAVRQEDVCNRFDPSIASQSRLQGSNLTISSSFPARAPFLRQLWSTLASTFTCANIDLYFTASSGVVSFPSHESCVDVENVEMTVSACSAAQRQPQRNVADMNEADRRSHKACQTLRANNIERLPVRVSALPRRRDGGH